jgi:hypothetical protein
MKEYEQKNPNYDKTIFTNSSTLNFISSEIRNFTHQVKPLEVAVTFEHKNLSRTKHKIIYLLGKVNMGKRGFFNLHLYYLSH